MRGAAEFRLFSSPLVSHPVFAPFSSRPVSSPSGNPPPPAESNRRVFSVDSGYSDKSSLEISLVRSRGLGIIPEIRYKFIRGARYTRMAGLRGSRGGLPAVLTAGNY